ncbi:hypothetical protein MRY87_09555 [bacterium]|nr:hypothetical protein [bacterium]
MVQVILWSAKNESEQPGVLNDAVAGELESPVQVCTEQEALGLLRESPAGGHETLVFIERSLPLSLGDITEIEKQAKAFSGDYATISIGDLFSPEVDSATLVQSLSPSQSWNTGIVFVREKTAELMEEEKSLPLALLKVAVHLLGENREISWNIAHIELGKDNGEHGSIETRLSPQENGELLQFALASINIEELFPNHPWETFESESAAACYHTLAGRFIAFGALDKAQECLLYGDRLEDSPRSLALRGLIALRQGETLAAVANMVSSLQEYEKRKTQDEKHYLNFQPENLEVINSNLQDGLSALNKRENDRAVECFTDAVFQFDTFYKECGLVQ